MPFEGIAGGSKRGSKVDGIHQANAAHAPSEGRQNKLLTHYVARALYLGKLMSNLRLEPSRLQEYQNKKLRAIVKHAYEHVPFYRRKFDKAGLKPYDIASVQDLQELPMTTKEEIQGTPLSGVIPRGINVDDCTKGVTSGSCGMPLTVIIGKKAQDFRNALWIRASLENGLRPWDKMAILTMPKRFQSHRRWIDPYGLLKRKEISVFENVQRQAKLIEFYKPDLLRGFSSSLAILADFCSDRKHGVHPRSIFTGAELLHEKDRKLMSSVFGCDVFDYYGSSEFGLLAWECQNHSGYHMNMDSTVMEFVNHGEAVAPGERGEIVCTNLVNYAMPLIRYRIGDIGTMIEERCSCGISLPLLRMMEGRVDDFLTTLDGRIISPIIFTPYPFRSLAGIKRFIIVQKERDKLLIQMAVKEEATIDHCVLDEARREIERVFGKGMRVEFQITNKLEKSPNGKLRQVTSHVPVPWR